mmetsp:Transcript_6517/g.27785  ORF Transcript_6517/g.27785 Transcript_6517/m.27785 type:complete len:760 (+) Transcript_6517:43-2322(+)
MHLARLLLFLAKPQKRSHAEPGGLAGRRRFRRARVFRFRLLRLLGQVARLPRDRFRLRIVSLRDHSAAAHVHHPVHRHLPLMQRRLHADGRGERRRDHAQRGHRARRRARATGLAFPAWRGRSGGRRVRRVDRSLQSVRERVERRRLQRVVDERHVGRLAVVGERDARLVERALAGAGVAAGRRRGRHRRAPAREHLERRAERHGVFRLLAVPVLLVRVPVERALRVVRRVRRVRARRAGVGVGVRVGRRIGVRGRVATRRAALFFLLLLGLEHGRRRAFRRDQRRGCRLQRLATQARDVRCARPREVRARRRAGARAAVVLQVDVERDAAVPQTAEHLGRDRGTRVRAFVAEHGGGAADGAAPRPSPEPPEPRAPFRFVHGHDRHRRRRVHSAPPRAEVAVIPHAERRGDLASLRPVRGPRVVRARLVSRRARPDRGPRQPGRTLHAHQKVKRFPEKRLRVVRRRRLAERRAVARARHSRNLQRAPPLAVRADDRGVRRLGVQAVRERLRGQVRDAQLAHLRGNLLLRAEAQSVRGFRREQLAFAPRAVHLAPVLEARRERSHRPDALAPGIVPVHVDRDFERVLERSAVAFAVAARRAYPQNRTLRVDQRRLERDADVKVLRHLGRLLGERDGALEVLLQRRVDGRGSRGTHFAAALVSPPRLAHRLKRLRANARLGGARNRRLAVHRRRAHDVPRAVGEPQRRQRLVVVHGRGGQRRDHHAPRVASEAVPQQRRQNAVSIRHQLLGGAVCFLLLLG